MGYVHSPFLNEKAQACQCLGFFFFFFFFFFFNLGEDDALFVFMFFFFKVGDRSFIMKEDISLMVFFGQFKKSKFMFFLLICSNYYKI